MNEFDPTPVHSALSDLPELGTLALVDVALLASSAMLAVAWLLSPIVLGCSRRVPASRRPPALARGNAGTRRCGIVGIALDADEAAMQPAGDRARRARAEEGIEHDLARLGRRDQDAVEQRLGLLGRMQLAAVALQALGAGAQRE